MLPTLFRRPKRFFTPANSFELDWDLGAALSAYPPLGGEANLDDEADDLDDVRACAVTLDARLKREEEGDNPAASTKSLVRPCTKVFSNNTPLSYNLTPYHKRMMRGRKMSSPLLATDEAPPRSTATLSSSGTRSTLTTSGGATRWH